MNYSIFILPLLLFQLFIIPETVVITDGNKTIATIDRDEIIMTLTSENEPILDVERFLLLLNTLEKQVYEAPVNATINNFGNIVPEKIGYKLDRDKFTDKFYAYLFDGGSEVIIAPKQPIYPKVDSELLANIRVKQIGHYITYFNPRKKQRAQNISLAVEAIDNHVVFPGEIFSFNDVVGNRTIEKGYLPAPIIVRGQLDEGVGGGICQVSSTLFNAVDRAGLEILERYSHSRNVSYVPPGRDATVSWYGPDFTFKNKHNQPILIRAKTYGSQLIVLIYSSDVINFEPNNRKAT